jgi:hypothetical protein
VRLCGEVGRGMRVVMCVCLVCVGVGGVAWVMAWAMVLAVVRPGWRLWVWVLSRAGVWGPAGDRPPPPPALPWLLRPQVMRQAEASGGAFGGCAALRLPARPPACLPARRLLPWRRAALRMPHRPGRRLRACIADC